MAAFLLLLNVPGQEVVEPGIDGNGKYGPHFETSTMHHHGWPMTAIRRDPFDPFANRLPTQPSVWNVTAVIASVDWGAIAVDVGVAIGILALGGFLFQKRLKSRRSWRQFRLAELLALVVLVALGMQSIAAKRAAANAERLAVKAIAGGSGDSTPYFVVQPAGPTWLRRMLGESLFADMDRVVRIYLNGSEIRAALPLKRLQAICLLDSVTTAELKLLEGFPDLIALDLCLVNTEEIEIDDEHTDFDGELNPPHKIPRLNNLRGLNLYGTNFRGDGLENVPRLEVLDLTDTEVTEESVGKIVRMRNLRYLSLCEPAVTDASVARLADLTHLEELWLGGEITDTVVPSLSRLRHLRYLGLHGTLITANGFAALQAALPNCVIQQ